MVFKSSMTVVYKCVQMCECVVHSSCEKCNDSVVCCGPSVGGANRNGTIVGEYQRVTRVNVCLLNCSCDSTIHNFTYQRCSWQEPSLLRRGGCEEYEHVYSSLGLGWVLLSLILSFPL